MFFLILLIGLILSPVAGLMAFLITYHEYQKHFIGKREPLKIAFEAALFTFIFFMLISVVAGIFLSNNLPK